MPSIKQLVKVDLNQIFGKITVSSVLKDMIYMIAFFLVFVAVLVIAQVNAWIIVLSFLILIAILAFFGYSYNYLMRNNPDLLRSENYQLNKQQLEMMGEKGKEIPEAIIEKQPLGKLPTEQLPEIQKGKESAKDE
jgi:phosphoglycerol transferase MdoB-like AlkP superfamily enzyme